MIELVARRRRDRPARSDDRNTWRHFCPVVLQSGEGWQSRGLRFAEYCIKSQQRKSHKRPSMANSWRSRDVRSECFNPFPRYLQIRNLLIRRISDGFLPGDRFPTEHAICDEFGVSRET